MKNRDDKIQFGKILYIRTTKVLAMDKNDNNVLIPFSIILKEESKAPEDWEGKNVGITKKRHLHRIEFHGYMLEKCTIFRTKV